MSIRLRWLGTACFEIRLPSGKTLVTDPYLDDSYTAPISSDEIAACDYVFITHGHFDHVTDVGKLAERFSPRIYCSQTTADALQRHQGVDPRLLKCIGVGDRIEEENLAATVLKGIHVDLSKLPKPTVRASDVPVTDKPFPFEKMEEWMRNYPPGEQLNFVFAPRGGSRIYMAGTYPDPSLVEVARRARADITLLQVMSGGHLSGLETQTLELATASGCKTLIPQHHDPLMPGIPNADLTEFKRLIRETTDIAFMELEPGEWYAFD